MAIGKESMERAAKAAGKSAAGKKTTAKKKPTVKPAETGKTEKAEKVEMPVKKVQETDGNVKKAETAGQIVYQSSAQVLERAALPNESFGLGDAMPIYYL